LADNFVVVYLAIIRIKIMLLEKVAEVIAKTGRCQIEDVKPESELAALGIDSLKAITVLFELEEAFDIEIPNELISSICTVNDILDKLESIQH
jgi:acyl carrier protein